MSIKEVDCIILAMLKEERELFLQNNDCLIYDKSQEHDDFLEFKFFDKNSQLKTGVFCSGDRTMGNNEAVKLFYRLSRKYKSELYINIGVVGYISDASIGDVIIVDDNYSLCEKNATNTELQKTDAKQMDTDFIQKTVFSNINKSYLTTFKKKTQVKMKNLQSALNQYVEYNSIDSYLVESLRTICKHKCNTIKLGGCATYHSVVKDDITREEIKEKRKTNIVDMEAYYFNYWHNLIKSEEPDNSIKDSKMIFVKSISDTAIDSQKTILEEIGSRDLAMSNIYDVVTYYISFLHDFAKVNTKSLFDFFKESISSTHTDKLIKYEFEAYTALDKLCSYLIMEESICGEKFNKNYIELTCKILRKKNQTLVLQGRPGKGKSTFISYIYKKIEQEQSAVFISIPELQTGTNDMPVAVSLYLLKRLLTENKNITIFIDGVEGSRKKSSEENGEIIKSIIDIICKCESRNISLCIGTWNIECISDEDIVNRLSANNEITKLTFKSISSLDSNIADFVFSFGVFYKYYAPEFDVEKFVNKAMQVITNKDFQLKYVDFRLLYMFAKENKLLESSESIFEFIKKYSNMHAGNDLPCVIDNVSEIVSNKYVADVSGLLTKNIYSRAFVMSQFIYQAFTTNDKERIKTILSNQYILSDNINLFLEYVLNSNEKKAKEFAESVMKNLSECNNLGNCSKIQLLYNVSSIRDLNNRIYTLIKEYIIAEIKKIDQHIIDDMESDDLISYRTLAIILNNKFDISEYLKKFNSFISISNEHKNAELIRKINKNFHLLYYSQTEFTYSRVEESNIPFEPEVLWNTYQTLKQNISSDKFNSEFIEMCIITILQLLKYMAKAQLPLFAALGKDEIDSCLSIIQDLQGKHTFLFVGQEIKDIDKELRLK